MEKVKISKIREKQQNAKEDKKTFAQKKELQKKQKIDKIMEQKKFRKSQMYFNEIMKRKGQKAIKKVFIQIF